MATTPRGTSQGKSVPKPVEKPVNANPGRGIGNPFTLPDLPKVPGAKAVTPEVPDLGTGPKVKNESPFVKPLKIPTGFAAGKAMPVRPPMPAAPLSQAPTPIAGNVQDVFSMPNQQWLALLAKFGLI